MRMRKYAKADVREQRLREGDVVRIVGVPDLSGMSRVARRESEPVFAYLVGKYKRIGAFDQFGCAELNFLIRNGPHRGYHTVWVEPFLLRARGGTERHLTARSTRARRKRRAG